MLVGVYPRACGGTYSLATAAYGRITPTVYPRACGGTAAAEVA